MAVPKYPASLDPERAVTNASRYYTYDGRLFRDASTRGSISNPNHVPAKGTAWDEKSGYGGMPAPAAPSIAESRINDRIARWREENFDLAGNEAVENIISQHVVNRVQTEGWEFEAAVKDATQTVRLLIPKPTVSREQWNADREVERMAADRKSHGMHVGDVTAKRVENRGGQ